MPHVITSLCLREGSCAPVCPVECIIPGKPEDKWPNYYIDADTCIDCGACEAECPEGAISEVDGLFVIDPAKCQDCGSCEAVCPTGAAHPA